MKKFDILILDTKPSNPNHYICLAIENAFKNNHLVNSIIKANYHNAIALATQHNCNFFLAFDGEAIEKNICQRLSIICGLSAVWFTEDPYELTVNTETAEIFDFIFTNDSYSASKYNRKALHLPFAGSNLFHYNEIPSQLRNHYKYDIFFAGTAWPNRVNLLSKVMDRLSNLKLKIALPTNEHLPEVKIDLPKSSYNWRTPITEFCKFANRSKITLFLHREFSTGSNINKAETPGPRLFEVALAGGFQLVDMSLPEVSNYFEEGVDFVGFYNEDDCIKKINYYIENPEERIKIAISAQNKAKKLHTYEKRVETILEAVSTFERVKKTENIKINILHIIHNTVNSKPFGGTEIYCDLIIKGNQKEFNFLTLSPKQMDKIGQVLELRNSQGELIEEFNFNNLYSSLLLADEEREATFANILVKYNIHIAHFQHLIGFIPSLMHISKSLGVKNIFNAHDYYWLCPQFNLINYNNMYCHPDEIDISTCDLCLNKRFGIASGGQEVRRNYYRNLINCVDIFVFNTNGAKDLFERVLKVDLKNNNYVIIPPPVTSNSKKILKEHFNEKIKIALIGNLAINKGALIFIAALDQLSKENIEIHISGFVNKDVQGAITEKNYKNIFFHGPYTPEQIEDRLKDMDLSLHLSIWPETYCITLSEAWLNGLVPIVSDIGALNERVAESINGFKYHANSPEDLVKAIRKAIKDKNTLKSMRKHIADSKLYITQDEFLNSCYSLYKKVTASAFLFSDIEKKYPFSLRTTYIRPWMNKSLWGTEPIIKNISTSRIYRVEMLVKKSIQTLKADGVRKLLSKSINFIKIRILK